MKMNPRLKVLLIVALCLQPSLALRAQNETVNGNLSVGGTLDISGNQLTIGTQSGSYGAGFFYFDANTDTLTFRLNRDTASWLWQSGTTTTVPAMRLNSVHDLLLYQADGTTAGLTFNPVSNTISFGDVTLYRSATGMLRTNGGITVDGALTSAGFTSSTGSLTGGATGLTLAAGGVDQSVAINPSGAGNVNIATDGSTGGVLLGNSTVGTFTGHLRPHAHDTFDLGTPVLRWRNAYLQGTAVAGSLVVESGNISGGTGGLNLAAGAADQNIVLSASGTGAVNVQAPLRVETTGAEIVRFTRSGTTPAGVGLALSADDDGSSIATLQGHTLRVLVNGAEAGRFVPGGSVLLGVAGDGGNGRLQLASHSAAAGGIGFGSDTVLYRNGAASLKTDGDLVVAGKGRFDGVVRIAPQGDLSMGAFTSEP